MVLDVSLDDVLKHISYDASEIVWPELQEPLCRRAYHIEHMQYVAREYKVALVPYVQEFGYRPQGQQFVDYYSCHKVLKEVLKAHDGMLLGNYVGSNNRHSVAWNAIERTIYDPAHRLAHLDEFRIESFYAAIRIRG